MDTQMVGESGGTAVEVVDTPVASSGSDVREEAIAAVEAAVAEDEGKPAKKESELTGEEKVRAAEKKEAKEKGKEEPVKDKSEELDEKSLKAVLAKREKLIAERESKKEEARIIQQEAIRMKRDAEAYIQREMAAIQRERQSLAKLRTDPVAAVREAGWDPEEFILSLANAATPEARQKQVYDAHQQQIEQLRQEQIAFRNEQLALQRAQQERAHQEFRGSIEKRFLDVALNEEKSPYLSALYPGDTAYLLKQGDMAADKYRELTGLEATPEDIAEYLEEEAQKRYNARQEGGTKRATGNGKSSATSAKEAITLSSRDSSDRRTLSRDLKNLSDEERRALAVEEANAAISQYENG